MTPSDEHRRLSAGPSALVTESLLEHLTHLLPTQGPISVFVHHNTLHAFESAPFDQAVLAAADLYDRHPYLPEEDYRRFVLQGRIDRGDLERSLHHALGDDGDRLIGHLGTRHDLWMGMLEHPLREGSPAEVRWCIEEAEPLDRYRPEVTDEQKLRSIDATRRWLGRDYVPQGVAKDHLSRLATEVLGTRGGIDSVGRWSDSDWETFSLRLLWSACLHGTSTSVERAASPRSPSDRQPVADVTTDRLLVRFCGAFLDQGLAPWSLPARQRGFLPSFCELHRRSGWAEPILEALQGPLERATELRYEPLAVINDALDELGVQAEQVEAYLRDHLLRLPGWAGALQQLETNADWTARPAPKNTLQGYVAARLMFSLAARSLDRLPEGVASPTPKPTADLGAAYRVFQIAQVRGWTAIDLGSLQPSEWRLLLDEVDAFPSRTRRRVFHSAYERHYRDRAYAAISQSAARIQPRGASDYQVLCCIDDREESFRRSLEEIDPGSETLGFAGFFGVAIYYRGLGEAQFKPLCPVNVIPQHYVAEQPLDHDQEASRRRAATRRRIGQAARGAARGSRTLVGGLFLGVLGTVAAAPLVLRVVLPRATERLFSGIGSLVRDTRTRLPLDIEETAIDADLKGFTVEQMAAIVVGTLSATGLAKRMAPLVIVCGHGSSSLNNPHAAAYDCGACGGGRGGPNARAFASMANDPRVRQAAASLGVTIPSSTHFVGAYHNTCNDGATYYDVDQTPESVRPLLARAQKSIDKARAQNAHERARRFESADLRTSVAGALRHVEGRAADLSQVRSECGHATNAVCVVGRRDLTRGLFFDRRAFLASYDPSLDDKQHSILARILGAVIPVCGGINLEYYFSRVDNNGYGCGTKLPHNVVGLLGVMDGPASDLRTGLPWQMVEIHEPMRLLFVVETTPEALLAIMDGNPAVDQLVRREWVRLATIEAGTGAMQHFVNGRFEPYTPHGAPLPIVSSSVEWYRGQRDHLDFAFVAAGEKKGAP